MIAITTRPPAEKGEPIFLISGQPVDTIEGLTELMRELAWDRDQLAKACFVSRRTVNGWFQGRPLPAATMNILANALEDHQIKMFKGILRAK